MITLSAKKLGDGTVKLIRRNDQNESVQTCVVAVDPDDGTMKPVSVTDTENSKNDSEKMLVAYMPKVQSDSMPVMDGQHRVSALNQYINNLLDADINSKLGSFGVGSGLTVAVGNDQGAKNEN
jgi:hypothetical protein